jgi:hypothetical protein
VTLLGNLAVYELIYLFYKGLYKDWQGFLYSLTKPFNMRSILYLVAVVCIIIWLIGFLGYGGSMGSSNLIHILLVLAVIAILINVIKRA